VFVLGLGSQKDKDGEHTLCWFWERAIRSMAKHGLTEGQRQHLIAEMARKGARLPTIAQCEGHVRNEEHICEHYGWPRPNPAITELMQWLTR